MTERIDTTPRPVAKHRARSSRSPEDGLRPARNDADCEHRWLAFAKPDRHLLLAKPRSYSLRVTGDLDPGELRCGRAMANGRASGMERRRHGPLDEERPRGIAHCRIEARHSPGDDLPVGTVS